MILPHFLLKPHLVIFSITKSTKIVTPAKKMRIVESLYCRTQNNISTAQADILNLAKNMFHIAIPPSQYVTSCIIIAVN